MRDKYSERVEILKSLGFVEDKVGFTNGKYAFLYHHETLLSWAGYNSKQEWEDVVDETFRRKALIEYNFEDIWENKKELG